MGLFTHVNHTYTGTGLHTLHGRSAFPSAHYHMKSVNDCTWVCVVYRMERLSAIYGLLWCTITVNILFMVTVTIFLSLCATFCFIYYVSTHTHTHTHTQVHARSTILSFIYPELEWDVNHKIITYAPSNYFQIQIYIFEASESLKMICIAQICHHFKYF